MVNPSIFRAYDIRGTYPDQINEEVVAVISAGLASFFRKGKGAAGKAECGIIVGHDARLSSPALYGAVLGALEGEGVEVVPVGLITTPMLSFLVADRKALGGLMVTASHNPKEYNGLKVVGPMAVPISGLEIKKFLDDGEGKR